MVKQYGFLFLLFFCANITAQYTDVINSNRPGFSESPFAVGLGIFQVEGGFIHQAYKKQTENKRLTLNQLTQTFRMGAFSERFEWNGFAFQDNNYFYKNAFKQRRAGASFGLGVKYLIYNHAYKKPSAIRSWKKRHAFDWKRLIPSVGIAASGSFYFAPKLHSKEPDLPNPLLFPRTPLFSFTNTHILESTRNAHFLGRIALLLQNDLNHNWVVTTNVVYNQTYERTDQFSLIVSSNYVLTKNWAIFGETRQVLSPDHTAEFSIGTAFLAHQNLQFDAAIHRGSAMQGRSSGFSIGASYRFDNHTDSYTIIEIDAAGNKIIPPKRTPFLIKAGRFFKSIPQNTKELVTVGILSTGDFFRELFQKKKKTPKKRRVKRAKKPRRGMNLLKEQTDREILRKAKTNPPNNASNSKTKLSTQTE
jgi:hypothetical protein